MRTCLSLLLMLCLCCSELRERIQPEILELIKQQRLNRLCEGSCFRKLGNRRRQGINMITVLFFPIDLLVLLILSWALCPLPLFLEKFWFCRLSLNHKVLHYGDLDESPQGEVPFELLSDKSKILWKCYFSKWLHVPTNKHFTAHMMTLTSRPNCTLINSND